MFLFLFCFVSFHRIFFVDLHDFRVRATFLTRVTHHVEPLEHHKNGILSSLVFCLFFGRNSCILKMCTHKTGLVEFLPRFVPCSCCATQTNVNRIVFFSSSFNEILPLSIGYFFYTWFLRSMCLCFLNQQTNFGNEFIGHLLAYCMKGMKGRRKKCEMKRRERTQQSWWLRMRMNSNCHEVEMKTNCVQKHQWSMIIYHAQSLSLSLARSHSPYECFASS